MLHIIYFILYIIHKILYIIYNIQYYISRGQPQDTRPWAIQLVRGGTPQLLVLEAPDVICAEGGGSARQKSPRLKGRQLKAKTFAPKEMAAQDKSLCA